MDYTEEKPDETGYYYHINGSGLEEIVKVEMSFGILYIYKFNGNEKFIEDDRGMFGERIELPSEEY